MRKLLHRGSCAQNHFYREMLSHRDGFTHTHTHTRTDTLSHPHTHTRTHFYSFTHTHILLQTQVFYKGMDLHEDILYTDVLTQAYSCMISDGGHAFHATSVQQADVKPQFHRSLWRLRRIWWERVGPAGNFI